MLWRESNVKERGLRRIGLVDITAIIAIIGDIEGRLLGKVNKEVPTEMNHGLERDRHQGLRGDVENATIAVANPPY